MVGDRIELLNTLRRRIIRFLVAMLPPATMGGFYPWKCYNIWLHNLWMVHFLSEWHGEERFKGPNMASGFGGNLCHGPGRGKSSHTGESPSGILCLWVCSFGSGALFNGPVIRWSISFISVNIHVAKQWKGFLSVPNRTWKALSVKSRGCWNRAMGNAWVTEMPLWFQ